MNEISQREKREVLKDTYLNRAVADASIEAQGRFKRLNPTIITDAASYPRQPSNSPWSQSLDEVTGPEPPLGEEINSQPELGGAPASCAETATPGGGSSSSSDDPPQLIRRNW